ncbi:MAG TPA: EVE domain-containing protein [Acidimicrobiia bacterium]|nr:EVE domain-containing protein [Acidimicrobiia bacterium]
MRRWLMKSEPDDYSIDDLAADGRTHWDGVRNYQARNYMRDEMRVGDMVLFYHSVVRPPGVVGLAEVVTEAYPDHTAWDPDSKYYDPKSSPEDPRWFMVDVAFVEKFARMVTIDEIRSHPELSEMVLLHRPRLSVQPVTDQEFEIVVALAREADG